VPSGVISSTKRVTWIMMSLSCPVSLRASATRSPSLTIAKPSNAAKKITGRIDPRPAASTVSPAALVLVPMPVNA
jgi:hypothetical protein